MGFSSEDECERVMPMLADIGCDFIAVHHRTVQENYGKGIERECRLERAKKAWGDKPFFASGDIFGVDDVLKLENRGCSDGVMVARGLIRKPLLISEIKEALADPDRNHNGDAEQRVQAFDFFDHLLHLCIERREEFWSHRYLMELARNLFGLKDQVFRTIAEYNNQMVLSFTRKVNQMRAEEMQVSS